MHACQHGDRSPAARAMTRLRTVACGHSGGKPRSAPTYRPSRHECSGRSKPPTGAWSGSNTSTAATPTTRPCRPTPTRGRCPGAPGHDSPRSTAPRRRTVVHLRRRPVDAQPSSRQHLLHTDFNNQHPSFESLRARQHETLARDRRRQSRRADLPHNPRRRPMALIPPPSIDRCDEERLPREASRPPRVSSEVKLTYLDLSAAPPARPICTTAPSADKQRFLPAAPGCYAIPGPPEQAAEPRVRRNSPTNRAGSSGHGRVIRLRRPLACPRPHRPAPTRASCRALAAPRIATFRPRRLPTLRVDAHPNE